MKQANGMKKTYLIITSKNTLNFKKAGKNEKKN